MLNNTESFSKGYIILVILSLLLFILSFSFYPASITGIIFVGLSLIYFSLRKPLELAAILVVYGFFQSSILKLPGFPANLDPFFRRADEVVVALLLASTVIRSGKHFYFTKLGYWILAFILVNVLSGYVNKVSIWRIFLAISLSIKGYLFFFIITNTKVDVKKERLEQFVKIIICISGISVLVACIEIFTNFPLPWSSLRRSYSGILAASSFFGHHTAFGTVMTVALCLSTGIAFIMKKKTWYIWILVFTIGLFLSTIRRGIIGVPIAIMAGTLFVGKSQIRKIIGIFLVFCIVAILFSSVLLALLGGTYKAFVVRMETNKRYIQYKIALQIVKASPLFGEGPGRYGSWPAMLYGSSVYKKYGIDWIPWYDRMAIPFASKLGELGILGLSVYLGFLAYIAVILKKVYNELRGPFVRGLTFGLIILTFDGMLESFVHPFFEGNMIPYIYFGGVGVVYSIYISQKEEEESQQL